MIFCGCFRKMQPNEKIIDETIQNDRKNDRKKQIIKMILFVNKNTVIPTN
jgi:hypothetical protein